MGFFKEAGESFLKYSEKLVNKTEEYAKIAKLNMDIKRYQNNIEKIQNEIGEFIVSKLDQGQTELILSDEFIKSKWDNINKIKNDIQAKKEEIIEIKKSREVSSSGSKEL